MTEQQGPLRTHWNYFKRGKSEINFLLNIYQTIIIILVGSNRSRMELIIVSAFIGIFLICVSVIIGKYSLTKLDPVTTFINPFTQDIVIYRSLMAQGQQALAAENMRYAGNCFAKAEVILDRWIK